MSLSEKQPQRNPTLVFYLLYVLLTRFPSGLWRRIFPRTTHLCDSASTPSSTPGSSSAAMSHPRSSALFPSPRALGPSPMANESYHEMLYRLCRQNLPPGHPFTLTSTTVPPPSPLCLYPSCPVQGTHAQGLFTYRGVPNDWELEEYDFGASNPPPDIWFARHRIMHETGSNEDYHMVHSFIHYHYVARTAPEQEDRAHSPSVTSSGDHDTNMMELTEEMAETRIGISDGANGVEDTPTHQEDADRPQPSQLRRGSRTESESDAEMERHLSSAYFEMELEEAENRAAQMNITEETAEASNAPVEPDETRSQPPDAALQDLVEVAYMTCAANAELAPDDGDDGIL